MMLFVLRWPVDLLKLIQNLFQMNSIQRRELCTGDYLKNICMICLRMDAYELISFKLGMLIDMCRLYSLTSI